VTPYWSGGTGTLPAQRGRGLAKLAKSVALRRAARGIAVASTNNNATNRPMLAVNEWLGYRPCATDWSYLKVL
jgi:RimJ/RimL family protein N-acetyltransferase